MSTNDLVQTILFERPLTTRAGERLTIDLESGTAAVFDEDGFLVDECRITCHSKEPGV
jgi:hypothetical protein